MSSELTIDIQLTELGFSSWDFQLLKQKETPQTCSSASCPETATASTPSSPESVDSVEDEEESATSDQIAQTSSPSSHGSQSNVNGTQIAATAKEHAVQDDKRMKKKMDEVQRGKLTTRGSLATSLEEEEEEDEDEDDDEEDEGDYTDEEGNDLFSAEADGSEEQQCHVCGLTFSTPFLLREHMHLHTGVRPYCCAECGKQFCHLANYRAHLRSHAQSASIHCLICTATFATQEDLKGHLDTNHFEDEFYQCDFCKRIFIDMDECKKHVETHKQEEERHACPKCERSFRHSHSLARHLEWHKIAVLVCTDCGQVFSKKAALLRHSFYHLGLLPYTCVRCKRHFRLPSLYRRHKCKPDRIQCVACLVEFQSQEDFESHKKNTGCWGHLTALPAKTKDVRCMECGETFENTEELKKHAGTHQRVMKCSECGMGFRSSIMLMSHMGGHVAQRPCLCKDCGLGFCHQQAYESHLKTCGLLDPPEVSTKKPQPKPSPPQKIAIARKREIVPANTSVPKKIIHIVPLQTVAPLGKQATPSKGLGGQILDHDGSLVMLLPVSPTSTSECTQTPQYLVSSLPVPEKKLSSPLAINVPLATISPAVSTQSDRSVPLQGLASRGANILVPLTNGDSTKMRWTVVEDQQTPGSFN